MQSSLSNQFLFPIEDMAFMLICIVDWLGFENLHLLLCFLESSSVNTAINRSKISWCCTATATSTTTKSSRASGSRAGAAPSSSRPSQSFGITRKVAPTCRGSPSRQRTMGKTKATGETIRILMGKFELFTFYRFPVCSTIDIISNLVIWSQWVNKLVPCHIIYFTQQ